MSTYKKISEQMLHQHHTTHIGKPMCDMYDVAPNECDSLSKEQIERIIRSIKNLCISGDYTNVNAANAIEAILKEKKISEGETKMNDLNLQVSREYNCDLGKYVWTLSRPNGQDLIPSEGIKSLNYRSEVEADAAALAYLRGIKRG